MELNFIKCGDYYIPDIKVKNPNIRLGKWGRMRKEYLRLANPVLFSDMVLNETLYEHCAEIEETAKKRMEIIVPQLAKAYGVTEQLKAENQIEWVRQMNACVAQAEEAIKRQHECKGGGFAHFGSNALVRSAIVFPCAWLRSAFARPHISHAPIFPIFLYS